MDIHTPGLPSGTENGKTTFAQRPFVLPEAKLVAEAMEWVEMLGIPKESIPAFFAMAYEANAHPDAWRNPAETMRGMSGWSELKARRATPSNDFILDRLLRRIWVIDPLRLVMAYWSKIQHGNNAVMEQSFLFPYFGTCNTYRETVLIDPSPYLLELFAAQARARGTKTTIYVSNQILLQLYNLSDVITKSFVIRPTDGLDLMPDSVQILYCSPYSQKNNVYTLLTKIAWSLRRCQHYRYQVLMTNPFLDKGFDGKCFRQMLFDAHRIDCITIVSDDLCKANFKKQCVIELSPKSSELEYPFITRRLVGDLNKKRSAFELVQPTKISTSKLLPAVRSIIDLHRAAVQNSDHSEERTREHSSEYYALADLPFWYNTEDYSKTKDLTTVHIYEPLASDANHGKRLHRGKHVFTVKKKAVLKENLELYMEDLLLCNSQVRNHLKSILEKFDLLNTLSVKGVWALYLHGDPDIISTYKRYDDGLCQSIFGGINAAFTLLNGLSAAYSTSIMVENAVADYMTRMNIPSNRELSILGQVQIVFEVARNMGLYHGENPVDALMLQERKQLRKRNEARQNGGRKGLTLTQLQMLFDDLDHDIEHEGLMLATKLRMTGVTPDEVCALRICDYQKDSALNIHFLDIYAHINGSNVEPYLWSDSRRIRRIGLPTKLDRKIEDYATRRKKALKQKGYKLSEINKLPLFAGALDQTDFILPRVLRTYGKRFIDGLEILAMLPHSELRQRQADYCGDWYASTFKERAADQGCMTDDEIAHCMGHKKTSTYGQHYCDYDDRYSLVVQKAGFDNLFRLIYARDDIDTTLKQGVTGINGIQLPVPLCKERVQAIIEMVLPSRGTLVVRSGETGRLIVDQV